MAFLKDEFHALLEDPRVPKPAADQSGVHEHDRCVLPLLAASSDASGGGGESAPPYPPETVDRLRAMADAMISAGYVTECTQMFLVARRNAFDAALQGLGYEKASINDVVMAWDVLEAEIVAWIKAFRHAINVGLSTEHDLCTRVFAGRHAAIGRGIFSDLARCVMLHMLSFTEAVAMTKRTTEKLFKLLDMYEAVRDASPVIDVFLSASAGDELAAAADVHQRSNNSSALAELKSEIVSVRSHLCESAAAIFHELESSIRADASKQPVPGGAVHPLTHYVMNYVKLACAYNHTLEQVFREHHHHRRDDDDNADNNKQNPFAAMLMEVMELLHENLEAKSRLYKDPALSSIFLMNNRRYMLQKIRPDPFRHTAPHPLPAARVPGMASEVNWEGGGERMFCFREKRFRNRDYN